MHIPICLCQHALLLLVIFADTPSVFLQLSWSQVTFVCLCLLSSYCFALDLNFDKKWVLLMTQQVIVPWTHKAADRPGSLKEVIGSVAENTKRWRRSPINTSHRHKLIANIITNLKRNYKVNNESNPSNIHAIVLREKTEEIEQKWRPWKPMNNKKHTNNSPWAKALSITRIWTESLVALTQRLACNIAWLACTGFAWQMP